MIFVNYFSAIGKQFAVIILIRRINEQIRKLCASKSISMKYFANHIARQISRPPKVSYMIPVAIVLSPRCLLASFKASTGEGGQVASLFQQSFAKSGTRVPSMSNSTPGLCWDPGGLSVIRLGDSWRRLGVEISRLAQKRLPLRAHLSHPGS